MAGAFSGHLLNAFNNGPAHPTIVTSSTMSFDARAHGNPTPSLPSCSMAHTPFGFAPFSEDSTTAKQIATLQAKLNKKLGPEYVSQRPGPGGGPKLTYAEGWKIINLANDVFGFNGWSSSIVSIVTDFVDYSEESKRFNVGVTAIVRVTLRDGSYHEDVGYGMLENSKSKAAALDKCKKEAITDALKRTLRNFGNLLGNCLYDKSYAQEVVKIKVPPAKFDKNELYRRPEFEERIPASDTSAPAPRDQSAAPEASSNRNQDSRIKVEHEGHQPETPITYVPRHLRQEIAAAPQAQAQSPACASATPPPRAPTQSHIHASTLGSGSGTIEDSSNRRPAPVAAPKNNGLMTPIQTPSRAQRPPPPWAPLPRTVATSPLARMVSAPERNVSFAEQDRMPARASSADTADEVAHDINQVNAQGDDDDDAFRLSTQDNALFAMVDLGESDLGRPIDFDEGMGHSSMSEVSGLELEPELDSAERSLALSHQPQLQVRDRSGSGSSTASSSSGPSKMNARNEAMVQPGAKPSVLVSANAEPNASASGGQAQRRYLNTTSTSSASVHFPLGIKQSVRHTPKPVAPACIRSSSSNSQSAGLTNANTNVLKRSADVMQASSGSGSSTRPPLQGMGLAQKQHQQQQRAIASRQSDTNTGEGHDPKRFKC